MTTTLKLAENLEALRKAHYMLWAPEENQLVLWCVAALQEQAGGGGVYDEKESIYRIHAVFDNEDASLADCDAVIRAELQRAANSALTVVRESRTRQFDTQRVQGAA